MKNDKNDEEIRKLFNKTETVPDNINNLFDNFINNTVKKEEKKNNVIKLKPSKAKKVASIAASFAGVVLASGTIYAAITGKSIVGLFNINEDKYNNSIVSVNDEVLNSDISVTLETYAIDQNAVIVNYKIQSNKELNFIKNSDNIVVDTMVNKNIHIDVDKQNFERNDNTYVISTLYSIEKFESNLNSFELNIKVTEIAGVKGEWNFDLKLDKTNKVENKVSFYDEQNLKDINRIAVKTNYTPISMNVTSISTSEFSTLMNITIFANQNGVKDENKIEPKKDISALSSEYNDPRWSEEEKFLFEVKDELGNDLLSSEYTYTRTDWIKNEKLLFPNFSTDNKKIIFNIYLLGENNEKELVGKFDLSIEQSQNKDEKNKLDKTESMSNGSVIFNVPSKWNVDIEDKSVNMYTNDSYGDLINIQLYEYSEDESNKLKEKYGADLEKIANNNENYKYDIKNAEKHKEISKSKEKIGNFEGYQITYTVLNDSKWMKQKDFWFENNGKIYIVSIFSDTEISVDNNISVYNNFIESIQFK